MEKNKVKFIIASLIAIFFMVVFSLPIHSQEVKQPIANALQKGDTTLAINLLKKEIEIDKNYYLNYYVLGRIYYNQNNCNKADDNFETALKKKKKDFNSLYYLGLCYLKQGRLDEAQKIMETGLKKDKKNKARFEDGYGMVMLAKKNWQEADKSFRQALVYDSLNPIYHIHLGDANFYQGIPSLAIIEYQKALDVDTTGSLEVYYHWAEACITMKDYNCAIEKLRIVLTKDSTHADAWMRAGSIYFKAARSSHVRKERNLHYKEAIGAYKKYLELSHAQPDSSTVRVYFELAMSYLSLNGFDDAAINFGKVLSIPMIPRDIYFNYGKALWGNREFEKSSEMLLKQIEWVKQQNETYTPTYKDYELYQLLGDDYFYRKPKDFASSIEYYKKSLEDNPNQKRIVQNLAIAYHSLKSYGQAIEYYNKSIEFGVDSTSASIYKNAGYCALNIANNMQAGGGEEDNIDEENSGGSSPEEGIDTTLNYYQVAADYMQNYLKYNPNDLKVLLLIANTYLYRLSDCTNGTQYYEKILSLEPNNCEAQKSIGYAYFGGICKKNYAKALKYLLKAQKCLTAEKGDCSDVNLVMYIAQCYHLRAADKAAKKLKASADFKNAYKWYGKCLKCDPTNADCKKGRDDVKFEF